MKTTEQWKKGDGAFIQLLWSTLTKCGGMGLEVPDMTVNVNVNLRDPALMKIEEDSRNVAPMPGFVKDYIARLRGKMNELALLLGAGGGILGGKLLGMANSLCSRSGNPIPQAYCAPNKMTVFFPPFPIWDDVQTFDGKPWRGIVDVVSGGFPCQDISAAGRGAGIEGERSGMWGEMARIIHEVRPRFVFVENSPMLTI